MKNLTFRFMKSAQGSTRFGRLLNILFFISLLLFITIAACVYKYPENSFDKYVQHQLHFLGNPVLLPFWIRLTFFGSFEFLFPVWIVFVLIQVWQRKVRFAFSVAGLALGCFVSSLLLKEIFRRHRPAMPLIPNMTEYSFPSGHSTSSFVFCAVLSYSLWHWTVSQNLRIAGMTLLAMLTCSIGLSRIVLSVHYPTDVIAGFSLGMLWVTGWYWLAKEL